MSSDALTELFSSIVVTPEGVTLDVEAAQSWQAAHRFPESERLNVASRIVLTIDWLQEQYGETSAPAVATLTTVVGHLIRHLRRQSDGMTEAPPNNPFMSRAQPQKTPPSDPSHSLLALRAGTDSPARIT